MKLNNFFKKILFKIKYTVKINWQKNLINLSINLNRPLNKPTSIIIDITPNCVLRCQQCNLWKTPPHVHLTFAQAKIIIDKLHKWLGNYYLFFTGGEPFLNPNLPKIIKYAESKGIFTHVNSNAFLINKDLSKKIIDSKLSAISISLDGASPSTHDKLRGVKNAYKNAIQAIRLLKKNKKIAIYLNTVIMQPNLKDLEQLIKIAQKEKTNGLTFQCLLPTLATNETTNQTKNSPLWPNVSSLKKILNKIIKKIPQNKIILSTENDLQLAKKYYANPNYLDSFKCNAGINNFIINYLGEVKLCWHFPKIGNIFKENPKNIWLNHESAKQRKIIRTCKKPCKIIACNQINIERQKTVLFLNHS